LRAVLDANVIISALLSRTGSPATVIRRWIDVSYDLICSPLLLAELERALDYPKLRARIDPADARAMAEWLRRVAQIVDDPAAPATTRSPDSGDHYLIALAASARAVIVTGDGHLLGLADSIPVFSPSAFLELLDRA
jgi:putative PIN family toxin of toxin-antitoxin system